MYGREILKRTILHISIIIEQDKIPKLIKVCFHKVSETELTFDVDDVDKLYIKKFVEDA